MKHKHVAKERQKDQHFCGTHATIGSVGRNFTLSHGAGISWLDSLERVWLDFFSTISPNSFKHDERGS